MYLSANIHPEASNLRRESIYKDGELRYDSLMLEGDGGHVAVFLSDEIRARIIELITDPPSESDGS